MNKNIYLLDCTLRDGGYVNDWQFNNKTARNIINLLNESKVEIIECGIMGINKYNEEITKFKSIEDVTVILQNKIPSRIYTVMLNYSDINSVSISMRTDKLVDGIRLAFFKSEYKEALDYAKNLMELGYLVFLQAMVTDMYSNAELIEMVNQVNKIKPFAFSMVDSFGTLFNDDVERIYKAIDDYLDQNIIFGFHAHNNIQMAVSNTITFLTLGKNRKISVDTTVFGMGRGAGNAGTEIIMQYLNTKLSYQYDISKIIEIYHNYLEPIYKELYWGYSAKYYLTSQKNINSAYVWFLNQKGITDLLEINKILDKIPDEIKYYLNKEAVLKAIDEIRKVED